MFENIVAYRYLHRKFLSFFMFGCYALYKFSAAFLLSGNGAYNIFIISILLSLNHSKCPATIFNSFGILIFCGQRAIHASQEVQSPARFPLGILLYKPPRFQSSAPRFESLYKLKQTGISIFCGHSDTQYLQYVHGIVATVDNSSKTFSIICSSS